MLKTKTLKQSNIPEHIKNVILERCPYCNSDIYYSYGLDEIKCSNPKCQTQVKPQLEYLEKYISLGGTEKIQEKIKDNKTTLNDIIEELDVEVPLVYYMRALGISRRTPHLLNTLLNIIVRKYNTLEDFLKAMQEQENTQKPFELLYNLLKRSDVLPEEIIELYIDLYIHKEELKNLTSKIKIIPLENITIPSNIAVKVKDKHGNYNYNIGYTIEKSTQYYVDNGNNNTLKRLAKEQGIKIISESKYNQK